MDMTLKVNTFLKNLGIHHYTKGYGFVKDILCHYLKSRSSEQLELILQNVAKSRRTTPSTVLTNVSYAIWQGLPNANPDFCEEVFGKRCLNFKDLPSSQEFIRITSSYLLNNPL